MNTPEHISQLINEIHELAGLLHFCMSPAPYPPGLAENIRRRTADISKRCQAIADTIPTSQEEATDSTLYYNLNEGRAICNSSPMEKVSPSPTSNMTLNDRYLFSRELFSGDLKLLDQTVRALSGADPLVIENFFSKKSCWDSKNPTVKRFRQILFGKL